MTRLMMPVALQAWRLKPSLRKLQRSCSLIMGTYYGFLWAITILNLFRCILQMARNGTSNTHASLWNTLWLLTRFGEYHCTHPVLNACCKTRQRLQQQDAVHTQGFDSLQNAIFQQLTPDHR